jgi:hypothetical protein
MLQLATQRPRKERRVRHLAAHGAPHRRRQQLPGAEPAPVEQVEAIARVAGEKLIAAFPGQHHLDALRRQLRNEVQRYARRPDDGLVFVPD